MVYFFLLQRIEKDDFEVDSTESVWYILRAESERCLIILKLTPQSQYGIAALAAAAAALPF